MKSKDPGIGTQVGRRHARRRWTSALAGVLVAGWGLVGCGGGPAHRPGAADAGSTATTAPSSGSGAAGQSRLSQELQFAQCMRSHGVSGFPDPPANGGLLNAVVAAGINTHSPTYQAALQSCEKYSPAGNVSGAESAADQAKGVQFAQCMRSHGVPNYPDPTIGPTGAPAVNLGAAGIDPGSPAVQAANQACQKIVPGSK